MTLPDDLSQKTLTELVTTIGATEVHGTDGGAFLDLINPKVQEAPLGKLRIFTAEGIAKVVYCGLAVKNEYVEMDTHMIFAFGPAESGIPHYTLDSVHANGVLAFHLDMIPRAELATHVPYMDWAYGGLTEIYKDVSAWDGLTPAHITPRQYAMMSPWMLVKRAEADAFAKMDGPVLSYMRHWAQLVKAGVPDEIATSLKDADLPYRDHALRSNLFSPEVDPVWADVGRLLDEPTVLTIRRELINNEV